MWTEITIPQASCASPQWNCASCEVGGGWGRGVEKRFPWQSWVFAGSGRNTTSLANSPLLHNSAITQQPGALESSQRLCGYIVTICEEPGQPGCRWAILPSKPLKTHISATIHARALQTTKSENSADSEDSIAATMQGMPNLTDEGLIRSLGCNPILSI